MVHLDPTLGFSWGQLVALTFPLSEDPVILFIYLQHLLSWSAGSFVHPTADLFFSVFAVIHFWRGLV